MLFKFLSKYRDFGLLVTRLGLGVMFLLHGLPKLTGGPQKWKGLGAAMGNLGIDFYPVIWGFLAAVTEGIGGILLILGVFYRPTCLLLTFVMVVATVKHFSAGDTFIGTVSYPLELAFVFFGLAFAGPGRFSIDKD